jgi:hypothetical protein
MELKSFLGTGWSFPPGFSKKGKHAQLSSDEKDIEESIRIILNTIPGERLMRPEFGCGINRFVFEKQDSAFITGLNHIIYHSLLNFEPRINFIDAVVAETDSLDGILHIQINYSIIITNTRHNIVFPFYLLEGTNI